MSHLPVVRPARLGLFLASEAAAAGWTPDQLAHAVHRGRRVRIRRGVYATPVDGGVPSAAVTELERARCAIAASLTNHAAIVSHLGAATARGWPTWAKADAGPCVVVPIGPTRVADVHVHRTLGRPGDFVRRGDVRLTSAARTVVDIAREFGTESALVSADAAMARAEVDRAQLAAAVLAANGRRGVDHATSLADLVDPSAESPLESRSRWQLACHGVPGPLTQVEIYDRDGTFLGRVDFYWPAGVVGEVDGSAKYTDPSVLRREKWRQEKLERVRLRVVRWGAVDLGRFGPTAHRIRSACHDAQDDPREPGWVAVHRGQVVPWREVVPRRG